MKYYLGRFKDKKYEPINCIDETDILSVINFTSKFSDEDQLRKYLYEHKLIDGDEKIAYVYKKKDEYLKIYNGDSLTYSFAKDYNTSNGLYFTLVREKYNVELFAFISKQILDKYAGVKNHIAERERILEVYNEVLYANQIGINKYEESSDKKDLSNLIRNFVKASIGIYDKETKKYKVTNRRIDVDKRKLADLILILNNYYNEKIRDYFYASMSEEENENNDTYEEIDDYDKEEFLTDEDFESHNMDPQDYKRLIRN